MKLSEMTEDQFRAHVAEHAPHLVDALAEADNGNGSGGLDETTVQQMLALVEERYAERVEESRRGARDGAGRRAREAPRLRRPGAGPDREGRGPDRRPPHRPARPLLATPTASLRPGCWSRTRRHLDTAVDADVQHALDLIQESRPKPRVNGLGSGDGEGDEQAAVRAVAGPSHLQEMGVMPLDADGKPDTARLLDGTVN